jgi:uncharacterized protein YjiS (DUF1127 family)
MCESDEFYFLRFEHRPLTPAQWNLIEQDAIRRARRERVRTLRRLFGSIARALQAVAGTLLGKGAEWWSRYARWRQFRAAVRELSRLDDRALKDLGLHRSEIESVVYKTMNDSRQSFFITST